MTRPFILHENRRAAIIALAEFGISNRAIARHVCCAPATIRNTAMRDPAFRQELETARFKFILKSHRTIHKQAEKSWRAANLLLERADPENFGRRRPGSITPAQQARQFKTWTRTLVAALPPEQREAIEREAARVAQELSAALDDDDCPGQEYPDDFIPLDPTQEEIDNLYNPPFPPVVGQSVSPRPPGQVEEFPPRSTVPSSTAVASAAAPPQADSAGVVDAPQSVSPRPPGQVDESSLRSTVPSPTAVASSDAFPPTDSPAVAAPPPVSPASATAAPRTPRTHDLLIFSDDDPSCPLAAYRREVADFDRPHTAREIRNMPDTQRTVDILNNEILILLSAGRKEEAIRFYRTASAISLAEARQAVEDIDTLRDKSQPTVRQTPENRYIGVAEHLAAQAKRITSADAQSPILTRRASFDVARFLRFYAASRYSLGKLLRISRFIFRTPPGVSRRSAR